MLAEDALSDEQIASDVGVSRKSLAQWKTDAVFNRRVAELVEQRKDAAMRHSIAQQDKRIGSMNDRWQKMHDIISARALDFDGLVPGGETGLLTRQIKLSNTGMTVEEYVIDALLLREMRALEEQAAKELGQWIERKEHTGKDGGPIGVTIRTVIAVLPPGMQPELEDGVE